LPLSLAIVRLRLERPTIGVYPKAAKLQQEECTRERRFLKAKFKAGALKKQAYSSYCASTQIARAIST
jgi:hypothetical protein